ncbi:fumarylacetoacetase [Panicum miliaceum]|uniref:Fumarylacetoacetase n=1 Tax=Panicum miliaceum TaxID=4540 RepID=A0A3L6PT13_PANMI|nr:fumarylacetoacetase [Panicum miliaceum]
MISPPSPRAPASAGRRFSFSAGAFAGVNVVAGESSLARVEGGSAAAGDAHAKLGSKRDGDGSVEMEACIGLGSRRIGDGIAQMDVRIGAAAFFIDPGELTSNALPHPEPALRGFPPAGVASAAAPRGQGHPTGNSSPYFSPSQKPDFELEMAAIVGPGNELGKPIVEHHTFGLALMNDWSGTTISPWIVTLDALKPFTYEASKQV